MTKSPNAIEPVELNTAALPHGREDIARMIVKAFADGGFGASQQLAALANAITESNLDPNAVSVAEPAVGLFQLNMAHGLGRGHTEADLKDPVTNVNLTLVEAKKHGAFNSADSLEGAVSAFVRSISRPANPAAQIGRCLKIAEKIGPVG